MGLKEQAKELFKNGKLLIEISKQLGVPEGTVRVWKKRYNWDGTSETLQVKKNKRNVTVVDETLQKLDKSKLTEKEKLFCAYYLKYFNASKAVRLAGYETKRPDMTGYELLRKPDVRKEIEEIRKEQLLMALDRDDIIKRNIDIAFSDLNDFVDERGYIRNISTIDGTLIKKFSIKDTEEGREIKFELEDRQKALEFLAKTTGIDPAWDKMKKGNNEDEDEEDNNKAIVEVEYV
ncbi:MAG: terminase small subunit [Fusobacteriaceae bacterium]